MKPLTALVAWLLLFLAFLVLRFPYRTVFERSVARLETATGADLAWQEAEVGPLGVSLTGLEVRMPSGASFAADRARFRPAWGGLAATLVQTRLDGRGTLRLKGSKLVLHAEKLQVDTGSQELGAMAVSGDLAYDLSGREGNGELRMVLPRPALPPPVPEAPLEVGAQVTLQPLSGAGPAGTEVNAEVSLYGQDLSGGGTVRMTSQPGGRPPALSGNLQIKSPFGTHAVGLGGTWGRPQILPQGGNS